jgi:hypothetical protein
LFENIPIELRKIQIKWTFTILLHTSLYFTNLGFEINKIVQIHDKKPLNAINQIAQILSHR